MANLSSIPNLENIIKHFNIQIQNYIEYSYKVLSFIVIVFLALKQMQPTRKIKICAISDTHGKNTELIKAVQSGLQGDIFIHAGDYTSYNKRQHFLEFVQVLSSLKFKHKIVIPGNHQMLMDSSLSYEDLRALGIFHIKQDMTREAQLAKLKQMGVIYLEHDFIQIQGIKFFCSTYTLIPPYYLTAFQTTQEKLSQIWNGAPKDIDVLVTHGPAHEILDKTVATENAGSKTIRQYLQNSSAKIHIFGHIHESKGQTIFKNIRCFNVAERLKIIQLQLQMENTQQNQLNIQQ